MRSCMARMRVLVIRGHADNAQRHQPAPAVISRSESDPDAVGHFLRAQID